MFLTRDDLLALQKDEWVRHAAEYMMGLGLFARAESHSAFMLADSLWDNSDNDGSVADMTPQEAVTEELSYWGE